MRRIVLKKTAPFGRRRKPGPGEKDLDDLLEAAQQAFVTVDAQGTIVGVNRAAELLFGYGRGELDRKPLAWLFPDGEGEPSARSIELLSKIPFYPKAPQERTFRRKDGGEVPADTSRVKREGLGKGTSTLLIQDNGVRRYFTRVLMENEHRLFQFLEILPVGVFILNEMGLPYYCNRAAKDILGQGLHPRVPLEKLCEVYGFFHAHSGLPYPIEKLPLWLALKGGRSHVDDVELRIPGLVLPLEMWGAPILNEKGGVKFATMVFVDITARRLSEGSLKQSEEKFHALADTATDAVVLSNDQNEIVYFNKGAVNHFGYVEEEVLGRPFTLLLPERSRRIYRDDAEKLGGSGFLNRQMEWACRRKDGTEFPVEISSSSWRNGDGLFTTRILRNISQRKQAERALQEREEMFRNLFEEGPIGMALVDGQNLILKVNMAFSGLLGFKKRDLVGRSFSSLVEEEDRQVEEELAEKLFRKAIPQYQLEQRYFTAQGRSLWCKLTASVVLDSDGTPLHRLAIVEDIDQLKQVEEMKKDLIAVASHQLKTPVAEINGYIEILLDGLAGPLAEKQRDFLMDMRQIGQDNYRLIGDLLNASKLERGVISMDIQPVDLRTIVELAIRDYAAPIRQKGLELCLRGMEEGIWVEADKDKTVEALRNIINNAVKCTDRGSLTLEVLAVEGEGRVKVTDTGIGMDAGTLARLFTKSRVLGKEASRAGAGLGLYIAKSFFQLQRGDIDVASEPGKGTCFTLRLPKGLPRTV